MKIIKSKRIYFEDGVRDGYLVIDQGKFKGYLTADCKVEEYEDYDNDRIIPGIFDTHNHGTYGYGLATKYDTDEEIRECAKGYLKALTYEGVTSIFPTITDNIKQVAEVAVENKYKGATVLGIHSEGPYSNIAKRQVAILYELVFSNGKYLTYDYFKKVFYITEKTIRDDIQTINFYYQI